MSNATPVRIYLSPPHLCGQEEVFVQDAFASNWVAPLGPHVDAFEQELIQYTGTAACTALSSGTAALHLALILADVGPGDRVICPSFTFSASANPITYLGAEPVFVDSETLTWNMDPALCEEAIQWCIREGRAPKAIIVVHLYGMPAQMDAFLALAERYHIPLIEDAAESLGSYYREKLTGTWGDFGVFSFNGNKIITTSGGGALAGKDAAAIAQAKFLATQARDPAPHYQHSTIGYNYRMSNICAAIGRGQMTVLDERVQARRRVYDHYRNALAEVPGFTFLPEPPGHFSNRWLTTLLIDPAVARTDTDTIRLRLAAAGIEARPLWKPMHLQPVFSRARAFVNGHSERFFQQGICLPSGSALSTAQQDEVIDLLLSTRG